MIDFLPSIWPWAARSAFSESAGQLLQFCALIGFVLLTVAYFMVYLMPKPHRSIIRGVVFIGSLFFIIALHTHNELYYPQLLMAAYMLISILPESWMRKNEKKNHS